MPECFDNGYIINDYNSIQKATKNRLLGDIERIKDRLLKQTKAIEENLAIVRHELKNDQLELHYLALTYISKDLEKLEQQIKSEIHFYQELIQQNENL